MNNDLIFRLRKRAEIRRSISHRKSVQENAPDRISDLLEEAANVLEANQAEFESFSIKLQRTVDAAYHALLEMSAWIGINPDKRKHYIEEAMSNVKYCAEHDLRHVDESQRYNELKAGADKLAETLQWFADGGPVWSVHEKKMVPTFGSINAKQAQAALKHWNERKKK